MKERKKKTWRPMTSFSAPTIPSSSRATTSDSWYNRAPHFSTAQPRNQALTYKQFKANRH
eukprot:1423337-Rhodomonas_salina.1